LSPEKKYQLLYNTQKDKINRILSRALEFRKPVSLYNPAYYIIKNGGKRLRPLLVLFSCKSVGGKYTNAYNAAASVELLHNFTLVHDDIMDNASKRRGLLTLHEKFDLSTAIIAGDSMLAVAYEYLLKDSGSEKRIISEFTRGLIEVCEGQALDKTFETQSGITIKDYTKMIEKKTAAMLIMCCRIGCLLGKGSAKELRALTSFGKNIGIAFQIQDDLLDIKGYEEFGKTTGGDLMEGKKTFLLLKGIDKSEGSDRVDLEKMVEKKGITQSEVNHYIDIYRRNGIIEDAEAEIVKYTRKAIKSIEVLQNRANADLFNWLADSLIKRNK
jgi:geranylgeranyl diphosphate synthase, type II